MPSMGNSNSQPDDGSDPPPVSTPPPDAPPKKKRRGRKSKRVPPPKPKKKDQTSQEEESAQALLALNKGLPASSTSPTPSNVSSPPPKPPRSNSTPPTTTKKNPSPTPSPTPVTLTTEIPDSDRIISQHLAAHMSKHNPPPPPPDLPDLLTDDARPRTYKRKRPDLSLDNVDPALVSLDEAAAAAKRKRRLPTPLPTTTATTTTPPGKKPRRKDPPPLGAAGGGAGGTFSLEERHAIDTHLSAYMLEHSLSHTDLCNRVWSNDRKKDDFWESVCAVLPSRSRASIYKHVRRSYHVFQQRAKWTVEDDEELARLVAEKGSSWKDVGDAMGRMGEDCRDRWRNYVKCGKERGRDRWGEDEEAELRRVLKVVLAGIRAGRGGEVEEEVDLDAEEVDGEEDINWTSVSELMGNKRSRIQCRYKWNKMKQQKARLGQGVAAGRAQAMWRKRKVKVAVEDMKVGDQIWLLEQIRDSAAKEEKAIPWDALSDASTWTARDLEKAYKTLRSTLPHRRLPLSEVVTRLLGELAALPEEVKTLRYEEEAPQYEEQQYYPQPGEYEMAMVDPALIGQGVPMVSQSELEKTAGEAMMIAEAAEQARVLEEGETERELRRRLGV